MVIPAMDYINEVFMTGMLDEEWFDPSIRAAVGLAKKTLNKYYSLMDTSDLYHIVMVLHPRHKLEYFRHAKWEADWIKTASDLVRNTYETSYASREVHLTILWPRDSHLTNRYQDCSTNIFDRLPSLSKVDCMSMADELDSYLATSVEDINVGDTIQWWSEHQSMYPHL
ncbi:hypothetical protein PISMIDRAFT_78704, partial [Pisolithus microcarpus 441]